MTRAPREAPTGKASQQREAGRRCVCQYAKALVVDGLKVCQSCGDLRTDLTTDAEMRAYLTARGWGTWYHPNYWVHAKTIQDPTQQDCTNYGMSVADAFAFDRDDKPPMPPFGLMLQRGFDLLRALETATRSAEEAAVPTPSPTPPSDEQENPQ